MASKREQDRQEKRKAGKVTYDLPPGLKQNVSDMAAEYGVPQSQIAALLLICGLDTIQSGSVNITEYLSPSRSPLYDYTLDLDRIMKDWGH
jgi:hypothetical protein